MSGPAFDPADAGAYRLWTEERSRFADLDAFGHINNNAIGVYFESARVDALLQLGFRMGEGHGIAAVKLVFNFTAEIRHPATVRIGSRVLHVGRSSFSFAQGLFVDGGCRATSEAVMVLLDLTTRGSTPLPDTLRARLMSEL